LGFVGHAKGADFLGFNSGILESYLKEGSKSAFGLLAHDQTTTHVGSFRKSSCYIRLWHIFKTFNIILSRLA